MVDRVTRPGWGIQDFLEWARAADQLESIPQHQFVQLTNQGAVFVTRVDSESLGESVAAFAHYLAHPSPGNTWDRVATLDQTRLPISAQFPQPLGRRIERLVPLGKGKPN